MKQAFKISFLITSIAFASCKKYEDGPTFSLLTKKDRVANTWKVDQCLVNGEDKTFDYRTLILEETMIFTKYQTYEYSELSNWAWAKAEDDGAWQFVDKKEDIQLLSNNTTVGYKTYKILKLEPNALWLQRTFKPDSIVEYHYVVKPKE